MRPDPWSAGRSRPRVPAGILTGLLLLTLLVPPGCFAVNIDAPYGQDVRALPPDAPVEVVRRYQKWYAVWGIFPMTSMEPSDVIAKERLVEARVRTEDSVEDFVAGCLLFILFPFGLIMPQTIVVEGNRAPESGVETP